MRYIASLSNSEKSSSCLFIFFSRMNEILYLPLCRIILDTNLQTSVEKWKRNHPFVCRIKQLVLF